MERFDSVLQLIKDCGANGTAYLPAEQISLDPVFRTICESNSCGKYGRCYMCPPDIPDIDTLMAKVRQYKHALLYQSVSEIEDCFDFEGMMEAGHKHVLLSQRIQEQLKATLPQSFLHLSSGGCHLCERCAKEDGLPCRHPGKPLGSLEGHGIDVCATARAANLPYTGKSDTVTYFGIILI